ncbi:MAG: DUF4124 domain-containing protein [Candidatus Binatia bacterium]
MVAKRLWMWVGGCGLVAWCAVAAAQTFYKWTDDQGVVHFADAPPPEARHVEERHLSPPAEVRPADEGSADTGKGDAQAQQDRSAQDPAQVILTSRNTPRTGPSALHVIGQVKNVGGADAAHVAVTITALDSTQGTPCLNEEAAVTPSTLHPGETGNFDVVLDSPCLFGQPNLDIAPVWG